jgi:hypothetical protein
MKLKSLIAFVVTLATISFFGTRFVRSQFEVDSRSSKIYDLMKAWKYPGGRSLTSDEGGTAPNCIHSSSYVNTDDDFDKVCRFYQEKTHIFDRMVQIDKKYKGRDVVRGGENGGDRFRDLFEDRDRSSVRLRIYNKLDREWYYLVVISRGKDEDKTHIYLHMMHNDVAPGDP